MIKRKAPGLFITPQNLAELYTYLEFFVKYYDGFDQEAEVLMKGIREIYQEESNCKDPDEALRELRNPRNAGRRKKYSELDIKKLRQMAKGKSIREISEMTGIPRSTVQRMLRE